MGILGTYGDTSVARVKPGIWSRIVISVKCAETTGKGTLKTYVDSKAAASVTSDSIIQNGRFAIDPDTFFLFSSNNRGMMPGGYAVRTIRVEQKANKCENEAIPCLTNLSPSRIRNSTTSQMEMTFLCASLNINPDLRLLLIKK